MAAIINTENLQKRFKAVTAVDRLSLTIGEGEIFAFLGLNGAGKTTTIRMLLGMIKPTAGRAQLFGIDVHPGQCEPWSQVGYLMEAPRAYPELTVYENIEVARRLHPGTPPNAVDDAIERLHLGEFVHRRAGALSLGSAQRLGLAKALLHRPRLLILDEPANGLDPAGIVEIRSLLLELAREHGVTVFLSSHILAEVSRLAQRIGIIHSGRLLYESNVQQLEANRRRWLIIRCRDVKAGQNVLSNAGYRPAVHPDGTLTIEDSAAIQRPDEIASLLVVGGAPPTRLIVEEEDLEHYFMRLVGAVMEDVHESPHRPIVD